MSKFLKDNRGVSLVELLIIMAIMVVLASGTAFSINMVVNREANRCAENMKISLEKHRTAVMGKKNGRIAFFTDDAGNIYYQEQFDFSAGDFPKDLSKATKIGKKGVEVTCNGVALGSNPVVFEFNRSGSLKSPVVPSGNPEIVIKRSTKVFTLKIEPLTGKITLSK